MNCSIRPSQWDVDFAKALDTVPHNELLFKLHKIGIAGDLWLWLKNYLSSRFHCVCIGDSRSELLPVVSGVPQGSILGPLIFLVFVNNLPAVVHHSILLMFADDTKCAKLIKTPSDSLQLQDDLDSLCDWSKEWKLMFKETKYILLRCCTHGTNLNLPTLDDVPTSSAHAIHDFHGFQEQNGYRSLTRLSPGV